MMAISTHGIGRTDVGTGSKPKTDKKQEKAADAFASFMNLAAPQQSGDVSVKEKNAAETVSGTVSGVTGSEAVKDNKPKTAEAAPEKTETATAKDADDKVQAENQAESVKKDDSDVSNDADKALKNDKANVSGVEEDAETNTYAEVMDAALTELKEAVMDLLDMDEEAFDELLANMGFSVYDLMKLDNLSSFVLAAEDATSVDLLVNETLNNLMKNVEQMLDNLLDEYDITDVEVFISEAETVFGETTVADTLDTAVRPEVEAETEFVRETDDASVKITDYEADTNNDADVKVTVRNEQSAESGQFEGHESSNFNMNEGHTEGGTNHVISNLTQALNDVVNADAVSNAEVFTDAVPEADIVRQIIDEIEVGITRESTSLELQLNPEHLGKVQINVSTRNGVMQAQIVTESEAARHAVEASIATLKEAFDNKELKVDAIEVMVGTSDFFHGNADQQADKENNQSTGKVSGSIRAGFMDEDEESVDELEAEMMHVQGNTVSYMA
ncbi:MAG: flagellar hook-length control protein FliK [Clostridium sp.]|nr:flagellar hook-length control protein FliK [Clostridium sp.]MCM1398006.1 flagellar hook-length control protein FliK [Clostridium sp.]MCM1459358.1 flagellar hook-length control protein FliK [Bacteroides sp.]